MDNSSTICRIPRHTSTSQALMDEFMEAYSRDFEITGGEAMSTFLGLQVDHVNSEIHMHMDYYVVTVLRENKAFVHMSLRPKKLPVVPNHQLTRQDPEKGDQGDKDALVTFFRSFVMKIQYIATWVGFDISFTASYLIVIQSVITCVLVEHKGKRITRSN